MFWKPALALVSRESVRLAQVVGPCGATLRDSKGAEQAFL